jgi:NAD(P)H-dependent FMN reductase
MSAGNLVLGLVGSPNPEGRTFQLVRAALDGAAEHGVPVELVQLADHVVAPCKDCEPWTCHTELLCHYKDPAFEYLSEKILACGALVVGTPIYWWDTSAMVRFLILKMFRVYARSAPLSGLPALGIGVAGGTGNGLVSGLRPLYHFFQMLQMRPLPPLPATRFSWEWALAEAEKRGGELSQIAGHRQPFASLEERLLSFDDLPYLSLSRSAERRLLAALATAAIPPDRLPELGYLLARAEARAADGDRLASLKLATEVYEAGVKAFEENGDHRL